jgi:two-component system, sensor histidine kinase LadS
VRQNPGVISLRFLGRVATLFVLLVWVSASAGQADLPQLGGASYWIDGSGHSTPDSALAVPSSLYRPLTPGQFLGLRAKDVAWIRFSTTATASADHVYLAVPDTRVDRATLYTRRNGSWSQQSAGDDVPVSDWPVPQAYPVFPLDLSGAADTFLLRVVAAEDFSAGIQLITERRLSNLQQRDTLANGLYLGLISMVSIFALVGAFVFKDRAHAWLGIHALIVNLIVARNVGIAGLHLWPAAPQWNDASEYVLSIFCFAPLLGFVAVAMSLKARSPTAYWTFCAIAGLACMAAVWAYYLPMPARSLLAVTLTLGLSALGVAGTAWAWWRGDRFAGWILAAFLPMLAGLPFPVGRWLRLLPDSFLTQHAIQIALGVTLPSVLFLLMVRSQERMDYRRRITRLDQHDPLTGLVNDEVFEQRLRGMIKRAQRLHCDAAVLMVEIANLPPLTKEFGRKAVLRVMLRLAGRLTGMVRPMDTVARVGETRYGVLMEGPVPADRTAQLGSKFLARLIVPFSGLPVGLTVRPRIAVVLVPSQASTSSEAIQRLNALLDEVPPAHSNSIFVMDSQPVASAPAMVPS